MAAGLPVAVPGDMSAERFLSLMAVDKKVIDGRLRLIVLQSLGRAEVRDDIATDLVIRAIEQCKQAVL
jgi:3-dehydroquinate synthase